MNVNIVYDGFESAIGRLWVAMSPRGVCRVSFDQPEEDFVAELRRAYGVEPQRDAGAIEPARRQITEYLAGERTEFDLPLDLEGLTDFQRQALEVCRLIPYGETSWYSELGERMGRLQAARAVGSAMARNPLPLLVPCHRVVRVGGDLGGYGGGLDTKKRLLRLEAEVKTRRKAGAVARR